MSEETDTAELKRRIESEYEREDLSIQIGELDDSSGGTVPQPEC